MVLRLIIKCSGLAVGLYFLISGSLFAQKSDFKEIDFSRADSIAQVYAGHSLYQLPALASKLTAHLQTDVEKFRAIYRWVCTNIENDFSYYLKNQRKRKQYQQRPEKFNEWNQQFAIKSYKRLLKDYQTVCTGYAALIQQLAYFADLDAKVIHGYGKTSTSTQLISGLPNHSWNAIKLNDKWYVCDPTWSAGQIHTEGKGFQFNYYDGYFLTKPELFALNHFPLDKKWLLMDKKLSFEAFSKSPIVYRAAISKQLLIEFPSKLDISIKQDSTIHFKLKQLNATTDSLNLALKLNQRDFTLEVYHGFQIVSPNNYRLDFMMDRKGKYIIHLMNDEEYLYSFELESI